MENKYISLVRDNIKNLKPYSSARHEFSGHADIFLDANENPNDHHIYNRYPDPLQTRLKRKISAVKGVKEESIFLGNGSDEAIDILFRIFCEPGKDSVISIEPSYGMYRVAADINNVKIKNVSLTPDFELDVDAILAVAEKSDKILWLCSPNNPSGNTLNPQMILELLDKFPGMIVVDEAYIDFSNEVSMKSFVPERQNLIILQTFSKAWGLAGLRIGMAFAQQWIIEIMNAVKPPYNINSYSQDFVLNQLRKIDDVRKEISKIKQERGRLIERLEELDIVEKIYPSEANFLLIKCKDARNVFKSLQEKGVIVRDRSSVPLCEGCLRVTIGTERENEVFLKEMKILDKQ